MGYNCLCTLPVRTEFLTANSDSAGVLFLDLRTGLTGLEPATSAVTGRCSNQLNYSPLLSFFFLRQFLLLLLFLNLSTPPRNFFLGVWMDCSPMTQEGETLD